MKSVFLCTAVLAAVVPAAAAAPSYESIVEQAFLALDNDYDREWAYTETSLEDERTWVGRFDPSRAAGERWMLVSVDGRAPSAEERDTWLDGRSDRSDENDENHRQDADIVSPGSLVLLEEDDTSWLFRFVPTSDDDDEEARDFLASVNGTLRVRKDGPWLEELELSNDGPIRPAVGVRFSRFLTHLRFGQPESGGPVVPLSVDVHIKGRALLAIGIDERESVRYSNYERVMPAQPGGL